MLLTGRKIKPKCSLRKSLMLREEILGHQKSAAGIELCEEVRYPFGFACTVPASLLPGSQVSLGLPTCPRALAHRPEHLALGILTLVLWVNSESEGPAEDGQN